MDLKNLCRVCLRSTASMCFVLDSLVPKFDSPPFFVLNQWKLFSNMLIATEDNIPDKICKKCAVEIQQMYSFILKCERAEHILKKMKIAQIYLKRLNTVSGLTTHNSLKNTSKIKTENIEWSGRMIKQEGDVLVTELLDYRVSKNSVSKDPLSITHMYGDYEIESDDESESDTDNEVFKCPVCRYECKMLEVLNKHLINNHTEGQMCKVCNQEFEYKAIEHFTERHRRVISMEGVITFKNIKYHKCKVCSKIFKYKSILKKHSKIHTEEKPFKCAICSKSYRNKYQSNRHLKSHTKEEGPFKCEICSQQFVYKKKLLTHLRRHREKNEIKIGYEQEQPNMESFEIIINGVADSQVDERSQSTTSVFQFQDATELLDQLDGENSIRQESVSVVVEKSKLDICTNMEKGEFNEIEADDASTTSGDSDILKCPACSYECRMLEILEKHLTDNHMAGPACKLCNKEFECGAIEHFSNQHLHVNRTDVVKCIDLKFTNLKYHKCKVCSKLFKFKSRLNKHLSTHTREKQFKCKICSKSFERKYRLIRHLKNHTKEEIQKNGCDGKQSDGVSEAVIDIASQEDEKSHSTTSVVQHHQGAIELLDHLNYVPNTTSFVQHQGETELIKHLDCKNNVLEDAVSVIQDIKQERELDISIAKKEIESEDESTSSSSSDTEIYKCPACRCDFKIMEFLEKHLIDNHMEGPMCKLCNQVVECRPIEHFSQDHVRVKRNPNCYRCTVCSKTFGYKFTLKRHYEALHTKEGFQETTNTNEVKRKPGNHECTVCSKIFGQKFQLNRHIKTHTADRDYKCKFCPKTFQRKFSLMQHLKTYEGDTLFKCEICPKTFKRKDRLREHLQCHTGEIPFKCDFCPKSFLRKERFMQHLRYHSKWSARDLPFKCESCPKSFEFKRYLDQHLRCHIGEKRSE